MFLSLTNEQLSALVLSKHIALSVGAEDFNFTPSVLHLQHQVLLQHIISTKEPKIESFFNN